ncbi:MAG: SDR family NAD(P)-dependent oxidoreductase [Pseudomonadota bacterium]
MNAPQRTALVTGANRGIGLEIARGLIDVDGLRVLTAARSADDASKTAHALGGGAVGVELDLSNPGTALTAAAAIQAEHGPVDVLVNNAAVLHGGDAIDAPLDDVLDAMAVNALAPLALIQVFGAAMRERGWGRIVNLSSGWGSFAEGLEGPAPYSISKAALNAVTVKAAAALGPAVKVNAACPGWVRTRMGGDDATSSPEQGADTPLWLATLDDDGPTGGFFRNRKPIAW